MASLTQAAIALGSPGAAVDVSSAPNLKTIIYQGGSDDDVFVVEGSWDNVHWVQVAFISSERRYFQIDERISFIRSNNAAGLAGTLSVNWILESGIGSVLGTTNALNLAAAGGPGNALNIQNLSLPREVTFFLVGQLATDIVQIEGSVDGAHWEPIPGALFRDGNGLVTAVVECQQIRTNMLEGVAAAAVCALDTGESLPAVNGSIVQPVANNGQTWGVPVVMQYTVPDATAALDFVVNQRVEIVDAWAESESAGGGVASVQLQTAGGAANITDAMLLGAANVITRAADITPANALLAAGATLRINAAQNANHCGCVVNVLGILRA